MAAFDRIGWPASPEYAPNNSQARTFFTEHEDYRKPSLELLCEEPGVGLLTAEWLFSSSMPFALRRCCS